MRIPMVPRPPNFILPKRQKGTESVVIARGTTSRMTMTLAGSEGTSLDDILGIFDVVIERGERVVYRKNARRMAKDRARQ